MSPDVAQLIGLIQSQLDSQGALLWAQLIILTFYTAATFALVYFGWKQIKKYEENRKARDEEQRKWNTIAACERLDTDATYDGFNRTINAKSKSGAAGYLDYTFANMDPVSVDIKGLLNCFDALAIGVHEGVYKEEIIRDHYENTIIDAVNLFLLCIVAKENSKYLVDKSTVDEKDFECLMKLYSGWMTRRRAGCSS